MKKYSKKQIVEAIAFWKNQLKKMNESKMLSEGMHWPEDYVKKAYNRIKASELGQQSWYKDEYLNTDLNNIIEDFKPLSHDSKNLGYFLVIIRWFIEYSRSSLQKYQEFLETKLSNIVKSLLIVSKDTNLSSQYKDKIKQMSFQEFETFQKSVVDKIKSDFSVDSQKKEYVICPIDSYKQMNRLFGNEKTGAGISGKGWCHTNGRSTYDSWISKNYEKFFILSSKDWKEIEPDIEGNNAYDEYGLSLIAIKVNLLDDVQLISATLRYNHVVAPKTEAVDNAFTDFDQLSKVVGFDVKASIEKYVKDNNLSFSIFTPDSEGNINCYSTNITSLEGAPQKVGGFFDCSSTKITSLEGAPQKVGGSFSCSSTKITSLEGAPQKVGGSFYCSSTNITSLEGAPQKVGRDFDCSFTKITSLEGAPQKVGGSFSCSYTNITSLEGAPQKVGRDFDCSYTNVPQEEIKAYKEFLRHPTPEHIDETGHYKP